MRFRDFKAVNGRLVPIGEWVAVPLPEFRPVPLVKEGALRYTQDDDRTPGLPLLSKEDLEKILDPDRDAS